MLLVEPAIFLGDVLTLESSYPPSLTLEMVFYINQQSNMQVL